MSAKVFNIAKIKVNGVERESLPGATIDFGGVKRETQTHASGRHGYTEEPVQCVIEATFKFGVGDKKEDFSFADQTVIFETDVGKTYVVDPAWTIDTPKLEKGGIKITIEGNEALEMTI